MHVANYLGLLESSEQQLADAFQIVAEHHRAQPDVFAECMTFSSWCRQHKEAVSPLVQKYGEERSEEPEQLMASLFHGPRSGGLGLVRDLHDLWLLTHEVRLAWIVLYQASLALRDHDLKSVSTDIGKETDRQLAWLRTRIKQAAPQALVASS